ncbi:YwhD family protein [Paenibacillus sp. F411]|uniref:YwhD family protein n=1 Tax=Paenibacillus algicola TaxID=2565926 RepID=A0A4P8XFH5_9BACL|nr:MULTISPECIES: YwhD family protein [Paenibacillus]MBO2946061.1 YwhD family protein [Paenibacillus sp. F411]QCT00833.1 hypothetical protein E6C60_0106 [Paenibacillus algicola]
MDNQEPQGKKQIALNIINSKSKHKGFGAGSIDLNSVSPVIIDRGEAKIEIGAMHAKSKVERGIKFFTDREEVPNGRQVWIVWVAVDRTPEGQHYGGMTACEMLIDEENKRGWKILAEHVNRLDASLKRKVMLEGLGSQEKQALKQLLIEKNQEWWDATPEYVKQALEE